MTKPFLQKAIEKFLMLIVAGTQKQLRVTTGRLSTGEEVVVVGLDTSPFIPLARVMTHQEAQGFAEDPHVDITQRDATMNGILAELVRHNLSPEDLQLFFESRGFRLNRAHVENGVTEAQVVELLQDSGT